MSRVRTIERLIADAEQRLEVATKGAAKIRQELKDLRSQLREAQFEGLQLALPLAPRRRGMSDKWSAVLGFMVLRAPNPVSIDELVIFAVENELGITRPSIRAQLHNYEKRGFVERVSDGIYLATAAARAHCDY